MSGLGWDGGSGGGSGEFGFFDVAFQKDNVVVGGELAAVPKRVPFFVDEEEGADIESVRVDLEFTGLACHEFEGLEEVLALFVELESTNFVDVDGGEIVDGGGCDGDVCMCGGSVVDVCGSAVKYAFTDGSAFMRHV